MDRRRFRGRGFVDDEVSWTRFRGQTKGFVDKVSWTKVSWTKVSWTDGPGTLTKEDSGGGFYCHNSPDLQQANSIDSCLERSPNCESKFMFVFAQP